MNNNQLEYYYKKTFLDKIFEKEIIYNFEYR
jgi:hypothetical protein